MPPLEAFGGSDLGAFRTTGLEGRSVAGLTRKPFGDLSLFLNHAEHGDLFFLDRERLEIDNDTGLTNDNTLTISLVLDPKYRWKTSLNATDKTNIFFKVNGLGGYFSDATRFPVKTNVTRISDRQVDLDFTPQARTTVAAFSIFDTYVKCADISAGNELVWDLEVEDWATVALSNSVAITDDVPMICQRASFTSYIPSPSGIAYYDFVPITLSTKDPKEYASASWTWTYDFARHTVRTFTIDDTPTGQTVILRSGLDICSFTDTTGSKAAMAQGLADAWNASRNGGHQLAMNVNATSSGDTFTLTPTASYDPAPGVIGIGSSLVTDTAGNASRLDAWESGAIATCRDPSGAVLATVDDAFLADHTQRYFSHNTVVNFVNAGGDKWFSVIEPDTGFQNIGFRDYDDVTWGSGADIYLTLRRGDWF